MTTETPLLITCPRCRHTWMPRVSAPVKCPICQHKLQIKKESNSEAWEKLEKGFNEGFEKGGQSPTVYCPPVFQSTGGLDISELRKKYYTPGTPEYENRKRSKERHIKELKEMRAVRKDQESE